MTHDVNKKIAQCARVAPFGFLQKAPYTTTFSQKIAYIPNLMVPLCFYSTIVDCDWKLAYAMIGKFLS